MQSVSDVFVKRAEKDGVEVPDLDETIEAFTALMKMAQKEYFDIVSENIVRWCFPRGQISLEILKAAATGWSRKMPIAQWSIWATGSSGLEFHSKMNAISGDILAMTHKAIKRAEEDGVGLVHRQPWRQFLGRRQPDAAGRGPGRRGL